MARPIGGGGPLARLRCARGLSQAALARRLGVTRPYVSLVESGRRCVPRRIGADWAEALDVSEEWLRRESLRLVALRDGGLARHLREQTSPDDLDALHAAQAPGASYEAYEHAAAVIHRLLDAALTYDTPKE